MLMATPKTFLECNSATVAEAAVFYVEHGLQPVKIKPNEKTPCESEWPSKDYGTQEKAAAVFKGWRGNIGIRGDDSGLMGIDCDDARFRDALLRALPMLTDTLHSRGKKETGHYWVHLTKPLKNQSIRMHFENRTKQTFADLRGIGGQIVVAPSIHPEGSKYQWINDNPILPLDTDAFLDALDVACSVVGAKNPYRKKETGGKMHADVKSPDFFARVKERVRLSDVLPEHTGRMDCIFHKEQTPNKAMKLYNDSGSVYCFSCGKAADVIAIHAQRRGLGQFESAQELAHQFAPDLLQESGCTMVGANVDIPPDWAVHDKNNPSEPASPGRSLLPSSENVAPSSTLPLGLPSSTSRPVFMDGKVHRPSPSPLYREGGLGAARTIARPVQLRDFKPSPRTFLVDGLLTRGSINLLSSEAGSGKSTLAAELAACVAAGREFLSHKTGQGGVVIFDEDNEGWLIRDRFEKINRAHPEHQAAVEKNISILNFGGPDGFFVFANESFQTHLASTEACPEGADAGCEPTGSPSLIIMDVMRAFFDGNENDSAVIGGFLRPLRELAERTHACILLLHHFNKPPSSGGKNHFTPEPVNRVRGSSAINGAMSICLSLQRWKNESKLELGVDKCRWGPPPDPILLGIEYGADETLSVRILEKNIDRGNSQMQSHSEKILAEAKRLNWTEFSRTDVEKILSLQKSAALNVITYGKELGYWKKARGSKNSYILQPQGQSHL